jgi:predicted dehydrogenase
MSGLASLLQKKKQQFRTYTSYKELLEREKPGLAVVNTHFHNNASVVKQALRQGVHVFSEKPLALELADLDEIEQLWQEGQSHLTTMLGLRYAPHFYTARQLCSQGAIGRVRLLQGQKSYRLGQRPGYYKDRKTYGGTIPWVGIHAIDWIHWFSQARFLSVLAGHSRQDNRGLDQLEMTAQAFFTLEQEILATVSLDYCRPETAPSHGDDRLRVVGTDGVLDIREGEVFLINSGSDGSQPEGLLDPPDFFADFYAQIKGEGQCSISAQEAIYITRISLLARQSADENRQISLV